jgi:Ca-activated chloride channel family protein
MSGERDRQPDDRLEDRLLDQALREAVGGERPPDLSAKILAAAAAEGLFDAPHEEKERAMSAPKRRGFLTKGQWAVAATLLVAAGGMALLSPYMRPSPRYSREMAARSDSGERAEAERPAPTAQAGPGRYAPTSYETSAQAAPALEESASPTEVPQPAMQPSRRAQTIQNEPPFDSRNPADFDAMIDMLNKSVGKGKAKEVKSLKDSSLITSQTQTVREEKQSNGAGQTGQAADKLQGMGMGGMGGYGMEGGGQALASIPRGQAVPPGEANKQLPPPAAQPGQGQGPGKGGDQYARIHDNPFRAVKEHPLSTFSIDVDTASYANVRGFLMQAHRLPPPDAVRIEEMVNYFDYDYDGPTDAVPFAAHVEVAGCPWKPEHRLVRVALKGREIDRDERGASNLVFLLDVSGSMRSANKLPLVKRGMEMLAKQLGENDRVAIVVYAGSEGLVLPSTSGGDQQKILDAIKRLEAGGSTNGGAGIKLAYKIAQKNFIEEGVNRVILCTDGDFNVGTTSSGQLERLVQEKAKSGVFLTVLGFGRGNLNDAMMEAISNKGNGNYGYVDTENEARKILVEQMSGTLVTIAKDVKIQIEFNPAQVAGYRLIGYENRILAKEDFNDDKKDAGEIGAGHAVTALYEIVPAGKPVPSAKVDALKYQKPVVPTDAAESGELLTLKLRYKEPDGEKSKLLEFPVTDNGQSFAQASKDFKFASAVAAFGMLLRGSEHAGNATYDAVLEIGGEGVGADPFGYRAEFLDLVRRAKQFKSEPPPSPAQGPGFF